MLEEEEGARHRGGRGPGPSPHPDEPTRDQRGQAEDEE